MQTIRKYGRTIIAILILVLSAVFGDADLAELEGFLTNIVENGGFTVAALTALFSHYFGERWVGIFEPSPPSENEASGAATMLLALMLPIGFASHAITPADLTGPAYSGETVTETLTDQTSAPGDVSLLQHRPLYDDPAAA